MFTLFFREQHFAGGPPLFAVFRRNMVDADDEYFYAEFIDMSSLDDVKLMDNYFVPDALLDTYSHCRFGM